MASKKELLETAVEILKSNGVEETSALFVDITNLLAPKKGGAVSDLSDFVELNDEGKAVKVKCRLSGVWFEANSDNLVSDKNAKIECENGEMVYNLSKAAQRLKADFAKAIKASTDAIKEDVINEVITPAEGKAALAELPTEPDYSSISAE
jgi:hypothetical protein